MGSTVGQLGEFGLIGRLQARFGSRPGRGIQGIGDDCAVLPFTQEEALLVTVDKLIQDVHFLLDGSAAADVGWKLAAVNLSDIAAMGGTPRWALVSIALPPALPVSWVSAFYDGVSEHLGLHGSLLVGGDTGRSPDRLFLEMTLLGTAPAHSVKTRSGAAPGDLLCVTGHLGDSGAGLRLLLDRVRGDQEEAVLLDRHRRPRPHLEEGRWLAQHSAVHAMMDVSDGIDSDLRRMAEASGCGMEVDVERLPMSPELRAVCLRTGWDGGSLAAAGGEDYCLLLAVATSGWHEVAGGYSDRFGRPLFVIGRVTAEQGRLEYRRSGEVVRLGAVGFDHFKGGR